MENLKTLRELVAIDSSKSSEKIINYIKNKLKDEVVEIIEGEDGEYLIIGINYNIKNNQPIILSGHIDTVCPANECQFGLKVKEGRAYGLGVIDMKCFSATIIDNIKILKELNYPIMCVFTTDEETELKTIEKAINKLKELNVIPMFSVIGEPTNMDFAIRSKGCSEFKIEVKGKSCHSSKPENGINSIFIISKIVSLIEILSKSFSETTLNCGVISGGDIVNRVPEFAMIKFDIRTYDETEKGVALRKINDLIDELKQEYQGCEIKMENLLEIPSFSFKNCDFIKKVTKQFNNQIIDFSGGCEAGYLTKLGGDAVIYGVGEMRLCHQADENLKIEDYEDYQIKFLKFLSILIDFLKKEVR